MGYKLAELQGDTVAVPQLVFSHLQQAEGDAVRVALYCLQTGETDPKTLAKALALPSVEAARRALQFWAGAGLLTAERRSPAPQTEEQKASKIDLSSLTDPYVAVLCEEAQTALGKALGRGDGDGADRAARRLMLCGLAASAVLSGLILCIAPLYVRIFRVEPEVRQMTRRILAVYAAVAPVKVQNMILGGGVIRSGGRTSYILWVDLIGTWCFGVTLACISAFVWKLPVHWVYGLLSLEECVRLAISLGIFRSRRWMRRPEA